MRICWRCHKTEFDKVTFTGIGEQLCDGCISLYGTPPMLNGHLLVSPKEWDLKRKSLEGIPSRVWYQGRQILNGDLYLHYNGFHIIIYTVIIDYGEFRLSGRYINAIDHPGRYTKRSLTRVLGKVLRGGQFFLYLDDKVYKKVHDYMKTEKIERYSQDQIDPLRSEAIRQQMLQLFFKLADYQGTLNLMKLEEFHQRDLVINRQASFYFKDEESRGQKK
jgi:hypothetical protein